MIDFYDYHKCPYVQMRTSARMGEMVTRWSDESNKIKRAQWDEQIVWLVDELPSNDLDKRLVTSRSFNRTLHKDYVQVQLEVILLLKS